MRNIVLTALMCELYVMTVVKMITGRLDTYSTLVFVAILIAATSKR